MQELAKLVETILTEANETEEVNFALVQRMPIARTGSPNRRFVSSSF